MEKLTPREAEVIELMASGYNNLEIAEKLCISHHTTKAHIASIYRKFGINNRILVTQQYILSKEKLKNKQIMSDNHST